MACWRTKAAISLKRVKIEEKLRTSNLVGTFTGPISPLKILEKIERGRRAYPKIAQIFWVPPIISETGKATDYKFGGYIYKVNLNKRIKAY